MESVRNRDLTRSAVSFVRLLKFPLRIRMTVARNIKVNPTLGELNS